MAKDKAGFWVWVAVVLFYPLTALLARRERAGAERIPSGGPALLVMNHVSYLDPVFDAVFVHRRGRVPRFLAKNTLWNVPVLGRILRSSGQIPVYRGTANAQQSLREAHEALNQGLLVVIYPEGTITRDPDGWPMQSRTGVARLALEHDVPVIPAARWGTREIYDHYAKRFRPLPRKRVATRVGTPVDLDALREKPVTNATLREATDLIMGQVKDLLAEIRNEQAPAGFFQPSARRKARPAVEATPAGGVAPADGTDPKADPEATGEVER